MKRMDRINIPVPWFTAENGGVTNTDELSIYQLVVGARALDVAGLLALVANPLTLGFRGTVARDVACLSAVVALLALGAVTGHVAETAAGVAGLLSTTIAASEATSIAATLRAVPGDVTNASTLVAFLAASGAIVFTGLGTFARYVTNSTATVAGLLFGGYSAFTADMSLSAAVVAGRGSLLGAVASLVCGLATYCSVRCQSMVFSYGIQGQVWRTSPQACNRHVCF
ncbi:hypothetical protein BDW68DRAFT_162834 [Aspergillus falconensis]